MSLLRLSLSTRMHVCKYEHNRQSPHFPPSPYNLSSDISHFKSFHLVLSSFLSPNLLLFINFVHDHPLLLRCFLPSIRTLILLLAGDVERNPSLLNFTHLNIRSIRSFHKSSSLLADFIPPKFSHWTKYGSNSDSVNCFSLLLLIIIIIIIIKQTFQSRLLINYHGDASNLDSVNCVSALAPPGYSFLHYVISEVRLSVIWNIIPGRYYTSLPHLLYPIFVCYVVRNQSTKISFIG